MFVGCNAGLCRRTPVASSLGAQLFPATRWTAEWVMLRFLMSSTARGDCRGNGCKVNKTRCTVHSRFLLAQTYPKYTKHARSDVCVMDEI